MNIKNALAGVFQTFEKTTGDISYFYCTTHQCAIKPDTELLHLGIEINDKTIIDNKSDGSFDTYSGELE